MMKQFLRVKQIADQKFQRSEKISLLSHELNAAEKRVDLIKESCYATGKKLSACTQRLTPDSSDKRNAKKVPEAALAQCMEEWGLSLGENSILGLTLVDYARIQETLANDLLSYKLQVEENVVEPLQTILNVDISNIMKYRKQLSKLTSEMETAKTRYQNAQRSSLQASGSGATAAATKAQVLKEETEDIVSRVDQCRDSLTSEMFNLISREPEMSQLFVRLCQLQLEHHKKAFYMLESALPELESQINCCAYQPVFGVPLETHLSVTKRDIATVIETCVCWLLESAMEEEGLFRIGGSMIKIKKMKSAFDAGFHHLIEEEKDPHNVAGILKLYLRSLPNPLLTYDLYDHWMEAAMDPDHDSRLRSLWTVVNSLPEAHLRNLKYLIKFLAKLCQNSEVNKMSIQNVAIVIGPNLLWPPIEDSVLGMNMTATNLHSSIVDTLITYADWFFPGDCEFWVSTPTSPRHLNGLLSPPSLFGSQVSLTTAKLSNGDSAVDSMSSSPTNSSPKSPSPRVPVRPRKKAAPRAPDPTKSQITRSVSCSGFQANVLAKANAANDSRLSTALSVSHENLLNANYRHFHVEKRDEICENEVIDNHVIPRSHPQECPPLRSKPPRGGKVGLPPVAERSRKSMIERPSVPPPERPDSFSRSDTMTSSSVSSETPPKIVDLEDISISFDSSSSESYNECQMSFADDSDNDLARCDSLESDSPQNSQKTDEHNSKHNVHLANIVDPKTDRQNYASCMKKETSSLSRSFEEESESLSSSCVKKGVNFSENVTRFDFEDEKIRGSTPSLNQPLDEDNVFLSARDEYPSRNEVLNPTTLQDDEFRNPYRSNNMSSESPPDHEPGMVDSDCHFTGGTPTWFDHYGDDTCYSNTLWFSNSSQQENTQQVHPQTLPSIQEDLPVSFCTIIEVGKDDQEVIKSSVSGYSVKLRVNSESQDTKL